jgi:hypothetical protein
MIPGEAFRSVSVSRTVDHLSDDGLKKGESAETRDVEVVAEVLNGGNS